MNFAGARGGSFMATSPRGGFVSGSRGAFAGGGAGGGALMGSGVYPGGAGGGALMGSGFYPGGAGGGAVMGSGFYPGGAGGGALMGSGVYPGGAGGGALMGSGVYPGMGYAGGGEACCGGPGGGAGCADGCGVGCGGIAGTTMAYVGTGGDYIAATTYQYVGQGAGTFGVVPIPAAGCSAWWLCCFLPLLLTPLLFFAGTTTTTTTTTTPPVITMAPPDIVTTPSPMPSKECCIDMCNCARDGSQCDDDCGSEECTDFDDCDEKGICITGTPECENPTPAPPPQGPQKHCRIFGDPHVVTFDGQSASFYSQGEYWTVKSTTVWMQGRYMPTPVTNGLSVMKEIAIGGPFLEGKDGKKNVLRISSLRATFNDVPIIPGFPDAWENQDPMIKVVTDGSGQVMQSSRNGKDMHVVHVDLPLNIHLEINRWNEPGEGDYINTMITMSMQPNQDGHCGNFNGVLDDDTRPAIRARIGTTGVPQAELLFHTKTPVTPVNRPDLNNCASDKSEVARELCTKKSKTGIPNKDCMIDVCFGGAHFADMTDYDE